MSPRTTKPTRGLRGQTDGLDNSPFFRALHARFYRESEPESTGVPIYVSGPSGRQCAGHVVSDDGRRILRKTQVKESVHFCHRHGGYGVELEALKQAQRLGAKTVQLVFGDIDRVLEAPLTAFATGGRQDTLGGFGVQVFIPLDLFHDLRDPQGVLFDLGGKT